MFQFDEDTAAELVSWVPQKLAPHIRVIMSMIPDTPQHKSLVGREPKPNMFDVTPLDRDAKQVNRRTETLILIIETILPPWVDKMTG